MSEEEIDEAIAKRKEGDKGEGDGDGDEDGESAAEDFELREMFHRYCLEAGEDDDGYISLKAIKAGMIKDAPDIFGAMGDDFDSLLAEIESYDDYNPDAGVCFPDFVKFFRSVTGDGEEEEEEEGDGGDEDDDGDF
jgi:hypothetical protein